jgi:hypothetical protein
MSTSTHAHLPHLGSSSPETVRKDHPFTPVWKERKPVTSFLIFFRPYSKAFSHLVPRSRVGARGRLELQDRLFRGSAGHATGSLTIYSRRRAGTVLAARRSGMGARDPFQENWVCLFKFTAAQPADAPRPPSNWVRLFSFAIHSPRPRAKNWVCSFHFDRAPRPPALATPASAARASPPSAPGRTRGPHPPHNAPECARQCAPHPPRR